MILVVGELSLWEVVAVAVVVAVVAVGSSGFFFFWVMVGSG